MMKINLSARAMNGIRSEVLAAFNAVPRRGAETGGILLGWRRGAEAFVEDFEPVLCEHRFGPSYHLSAEDLSGLEDTLGWFRSEPGGLSVLGFYRSHTRPELSLDEADTDLFSRYFLERDSLFLLLKPDRRQATLCRFFLGNTLRAVSETIAFPLHGPVEIDEAAPPAVGPAIAQHSNGAGSEVAGAGSGGRLQDSPDSLVQYNREAPLPALFALDNTPAVPYRTRHTLTAVASSAAEISDAAPGPELDDDSDSRLKQTPEAPLPMTASEPPAAPAYHTWSRVHQPEETNESVRHWAIAVIVLSIFGAVLGYRSVGSQPEPAVQKSARVDEASRAESATSQPLPARTVPAGIPYTPPSPFGTAHDIDEPHDSSSASIRDIQSTLAGWAQAMRSGNPNTAAAFYAPFVNPYFQAHNASRMDVLRTISQSLARYGRPAILRLSNIRRTDLQQNRAVATFRKHWQTSGPRIFAGEEEERLALLRQNDGWKIASEEEVRVFWTHRTALRLHGGR